MPYTTRGHSSTGLYYGFLMNIINLPIDVTVTREVMEKRVVEEGCLVLPEKKLSRNTEEEQFSFKKGVSSNCGQYQGFAQQPGLRLPACGLPVNSAVGFYMLYHSLDIIPWFGIYTTPYKPQRFPLMFTATIVQIII